MRTIAIIAVAFAGIIALGIVIGAVVIYALGGEILIGIDINTRPNEQQGD